MWEHKDGQTKSTAGRSPRLQWFEIVPSRDEAASQEVDLKKLIDKNPREVRKMVIEFKDLISELEFR
jgi:predicted GIY-YIG superfamily endonuclease